MERIGTVAIPIELGSVGIAFAQLPPIKIGAVGPVTGKVSEDILLRRKRIEPQRIQKGQNLCGRWSNDRI
jgi:hypothetical protein